MKLLIITQKVDRNDDVLGFFHNWLVEFSGYYEKITVICLWEGEHNLPTNVKVLSLGKEKSPSLFKYIYRFYWYILRERNNYDAVFVHMNQEYVLLGGLLWKLLGKKITMWRNHAKGNWMTSLAVFLSDKVFCTSPQSFTAKYKKTKIMPVGVDTGFFKPNSLIRKKKNSILFLGRIDPVKNVDTFIEALKSLKDGGIEFYATIAGSSSDKNADYEKKIRNKVSAFGLENSVTFTGAVSQPETLKLYREHELYVNLTPSGSMDKTIFEALASGSAVLVSNIFFVDKLPQGWIVTDYKNLAFVIKNALGNAPSYDLSARKDTLTIVEKHSLKNLAGELIGTIATIAPNKK